MFKILILAFILQYISYSQEYERITFEDCNSCKLIVTNVQVKGDTTIIAGISRDSISFASSFFVIYELNDKIIFKKKIDYDLTFAPEYIEYKNDSIFVYSLAFNFKSRKVLNKNYEILNDTFHVSKSYLNKKIIHIDNELIKLGAQEDFNSVTNKVESFFVMQKISKDDFTLKTDTIRALTDTLIYSLIDYDYNKENSTFYIFTQEFSKSKNEVNEYLETYDKDGYQSKIFLKTIKHFEGLKSIYKNNEGNYFATETKLDSNHFPTIANIITINTNGEILDSFNINHFNVSPTIRDYQFKELEILDVDSSNIYIYTTIFTKDFQIKEVFFIVDYSGNLIYKHEKNILNEKILIYDFVKKGTNISLYGILGNDLFKLPLSVEQLSVNIENKDIKSFFITDKFIVNQQLDDIRIYNSLGVIVNCNSNNYNTITEIDFANQPKGVYFIISNQASFKILK